MPFPHRRLPIAHAGAALFALASCAPVVPSATPAPPPRARAVPPPPPMPAPARAVDWRDWAQTPGTWAYRQDARGSIALFGPANDQALLTLRCDRSGPHFYLSVRDAAPGGATVRTTSLTRSLILRPTGGSQPYAAAEFAPGDTLLDAMGYSRGRFVIEHEAGAPLVVPAWAEVLRVVEDCRAPR